MNDDEIVYLDMRAGMWFIKPGLAGCNTWRNNSSGFNTKDEALRSHRLYVRRGERLRREAAAKQVK